jgi:hypothetical protein
MVFEKNKNGIVQNRDTSSYHMRKRVKDAIHNEKETNELLNTEITNLKKEMENLKQLITKMLNNRNI